MNIVHEQITLDKFCVLVDQHRQHSSLSSKIRPVILIYFWTLTGSLKGTGHIFANEMTDIGLESEEPDTTPTPVTTLPVSMQNLR